MKQEREGFLGLSVSFWILFILFFVLSGLIFVTLSMSPFFTGFFSDRSSITSDAMIAVMGIPVSLAGAVVAIVLAQKALRIANRQEYQDNLKYLENLIDKIYDAYWDSSISLRRMMNGTASVLESYFHGYDRYTKKWKDKESMKKFAQECDSIVEAKNDFIVSLLVRTKHSVANDLWKRAIRESQSQSLKEAMGRLGVWQREFDYMYEDDISDLPSIIYSLEHTTFKSPHDRILDVINRYLSEEVCLRAFKKYADYELGGESEKEKIEHGMEAVRHEFGQADIFILSGAILQELYFAGVSEDPGSSSVGDEEPQYLNYGGAFMVDMIRSTPSPDLVLASIITQLEKIDIRSEPLLHSARFLIWSKDLGGMYPAWWKTVSDYLHNYYEFNDDEFQFLRESVAEWVIHQKIENA